jgi:hypothetical protein
MMNSRLLSPFSMAARAKICCAVVVSASLIFAGSVCAKDEDCKKDDTWCNVKNVASEAKDVTDYFTAAKTAVEMVELVNNIFKLGLIKQGPDPLDRVIDAIEHGFEANDWLIINIALGNNVGVADTLIDKVIRGDAITDQDNTDADGAVTGIINEFTKRSVFSFPYNEKAQKQGMRYLHYTKTDLDPVGPGFIYDWRLGIPALLRVISYRLVVLGRFHPNFRNDGYAWTDLDKYREALNMHYEKMLKGVRCTSFSGTGLVLEDGAIDPYPDKCADIHTGLSTEGEQYQEQYQGGFCTGMMTSDLFWSWESGASYDSNHVCGASQDTHEEVRTDVKREVIRRMPLYEVKAAIDALYLLTHPMLDLTEQHHRLPSFVTPSLCLTATGANVLWTCDGDPLQHWVYDRASGQIYNPDIDECLEISYGVHASGQGFQVSNSECYGDEWQRWTYDPETHVLLSAMGTVLTIGSNTSQSNNWLADLFRWLYIPEAGNPVSSLPLLLSGDQIVYHAKNNEAVYSKQQWLADNAPAVVCQRPTIKQNTGLFGNGLPNC